MSKRKQGLVFIVLALALTAVAGGEEWPSWRGPGQNGVSTETGLIESWSPDGENLIWRRDFIGRSTPVVMNGRVYVNGRVGEGVDAQAVIAAFDAESGEEVWQRRFTLYLTTVP
ncbi:MAG: pyrrolo-quinoline quinone, partial [Thermoanaerobaculia bacterium]|nr:pyrrolo-quinoline quinone [Thermoanaerobaculia bacterium]